MEKDERNLSYQAVKPVRLGMVGEGKRKVGRVMILDWAVCNVIGGERSLSPCRERRIGHPVPMAENTRWITHSAPSHHQSSPALTHPTQPDRVPEARMTKGPMSSYWGN